MKTKIYLLPGLMCNEQLWNRLLPYFDDKYEFVYVALPEMSCFDESIDFLDQYFKEEKVNILGFSLGGYVASYFTCKYPHRVNKLFILAASAGTLQEEEIEKRNKAIHLLDNFGFKGLSHKKVVSLLETSNQKDEVLIKLIQKMYVDLGEEVFRTQMTSTLNRENLLEKMRLLDIPMTFLYCDEDRLVNTKWIEDFSVSNDKATFEKISSTSHMLPLERPMEVSQAIKRWAK